MSIIKTIKTATLKALLETASKDESRAISRVLIERTAGVVRLVTTDGHRLTIYVCEPDGRDASNPATVDPDETFLIPGKWLSKQLTGSKEYTVDTDKIRAFLGPDPDVKFPAWRQVLPESADERPQWFNPAFCRGLELIGKAIKAEHGTDRGMRLGSDGTEFGPIVARFDGPESDQWIAVIMPMRVK